MAKGKEIASVCSQKMLADGIYSMWIQTERIGIQAVPGQFIDLYSRDGAKLLPRPISLCEIDQKEGRLRIVYRVAGEGTREFSRYQAGDPVEVLGPLGNGFPLKEAEGKRAFFIGGGIGIPPMLEAARQFKGEKTAILGYRDSHMFLVEDFRRLCPVAVATEDGSVGVKGNVLDAIRAEGLKGDVIFACGPIPMLRAIKKYAAERQIPAYISLEEHMACGVGACLGCVVKTKETDHHSHVNNARICTDGPVFEADAVEI